VVVVISSLIVDNLEFYLLDLIYEDLLLLFDSNTVSFLDIGILLDLDENFSPVPVSDIDNDKESILELTFSVFSLSSSYLYSVSNNISSLVSTDVLT